MDPRDPRWKTAEALAPSVRPVGPLKRIDNNRYFPAILFAKDLSEEVKEFAERVSKTGVEDPRLLKSIVESIEGVCESLGWRVTLRR